MSLKIKTHGLDGTLVPPDWPPLTLAELRELLRQFSAVSEPTRIVTASPRPFSAAGIVAMRDDRGHESRIFIKRHHCTVRDREGLLEEHRFLAHLGAHGASVPRVLAADTGETVIQVGDSTYEAHKIPAGIDAYEDAISWTPFRTSAHAHSAGQALACLHLAAHEFGAPPRAVRPLVASFTIFASQDPAAALGQYLAARPSLANHKLVHSYVSEALELLAPYHAELAPFLSGLAPLWTHNDLHCSNLFWNDRGSSARATAIIDFGLADRTNAVHDIAHAIERNIVEWLVLVNNPAQPDDVPIHFDHLEALLDGYESVRPLSVGESCALAFMVALCHAEFALSEADYFLGVLHSEEKAIMAYDGWLVGHARWFSSRPGRALLGFLRQRAQSRRSRGAARP